jgi:sterol desaturase/sphingolipid hydroxylase (fatty acid hydroxylase superfamily)
MYPRHQSPPLILDPQHAGVDVHLATSLIKLPEAHDVHHEPRDVVDP